MCLRLTTNRMPANLSPNRVFQEIRSIVHVELEAGEMDNRVIGCQAILSEPDLEPLRKFALPIRNRILQRMKTDVLQSLL
jgi:hypothetical protein